MKKPFVLIAGIVAVVGLGTAVAVAEDTTKVRTSVSIKPSPNDSVDSLSGRVKAKKGCEKRRTVSLQQGSQESGRHLSDKSDNRGRYRFGRYRLSPGDPFVTHYWVVVHREIIEKDGERIVCKRARSKKVPNLDEGE